MICVLTFAMYLGKSQNAHHLDSGYQHLSEGWENVKTCCILILLSVIVLNKIPFLTLPKMYFCLVFARKHIVGYGIRYIFVWNKKKIFIREVRGVTFDKYCIIVIFFSESTESFASV